MTSSAPRSSRGNPSMGDVLRSVAVLGVIVLALWGLGLLITSTPDAPVRDVEFADAARSAQAAVDYPVLTPGSLPDGWRANSVRFDPSGRKQWHLGVLTDKDVYIGLEQARRPVEALLEDHADGSEAAGTVTIGGETWDLRTGPRQRVTFVREADGAATLVTSNADREVVERYIASLSSS